MWRMRIACWIPKATDTYSQYVILFAVPLQQWFQDSASLLRYTYSACLDSFVSSEVPPPIPLDYTAANGLEINLDKTNNKLVKVTYK